MRGRLVAPRVGELSLAAIAVVLTGSQGLQGHVEGVDLALRAQQLLLRARPCVGAHRRVALTAGRFGALAA